MSASLLVKPDLSPAAAQVHRITPESAGWRYVGFEVFDLQPRQRLERESSGREQCLVLLSGRASVSVDGQGFGTIGARGSPFEGKPFAVYAPARSQVILEAQTRCELAVGSAPAEGRLPPRLIRPDDVGEEVRGAGTNTRYVRNVLPASAAAERLLVVEVLTPGGECGTWIRPVLPDRHGGAGETLAIHHRARLRISCPPALSGIAEIRRWLAWQCSAVAALVECTRGTWRGTRAPD